MKPEQKTIEKLENFFKNIHKNHETSFTEIEDFLQNYMEYIFQLNNLDINKYKISIHSEDLLSINNKREKAYKSECNHDLRRTMRMKQNSKLDFKLDRTDENFEAIMFPDEKDKTKYDVYVNKQWFKMTEEKELPALLYFFQVYGHEIHHIIQFLRHRTDINLDGAYYQDTLDMKDNIEKDTTLPKKEKRILVRLINRYIESYQMLSTIEKYADKKGFDYLDILFNDLVANAQQFSDTEREFYETDTEYYKTENGKAIKKTDNYINFLYDCQEYNEDHYNERIHLYELEEKIEHQNFNALIDHGFDPMDFVIP